jgi:hypothetical protein
VCCGSSSCQVNVLVERLSGIFSGTIRTGDGYRRQHELAPWVAPPTVKIVSQEKPTVCFGTSTFNALLDDEVCERLVSPIMDRTRPLITSLAIIEVVATNDDQRRYSLLSVCLTGRAHWRYPTNCYGGWLADSAKPLRG